MSECLLVAQDKILAERYARQPEGRWLLTELSKPEDSVRLESVGCESAVSEICSKVQFEE